MLFLHLLCKFTIDNEAVAYCALAVIYRKFDTIEYSGCFTNFPHTKLKFYVRFFANVW